MLPWLKKDRMQTGVAVEIRPSDKKPEEKQDDTQEGLKSASQDLIDAMQAQDPARVASALQAAFDILDSMPHEEGPHTNESE